MLCKCHTFVLNPILARGRFSLIVAPEKKIFSKNMRESSVLLILAQGRLMSLACSPFDLGRSGVKPISKHFTTMYHLPFRLDWATDFIALDSNYDRR